MGMIPKISTTKSLAPPHRRLVGSTPEVFEQSMLVQILWQVAQILFRQHQENQQPHRAQRTSLAPERRAPLVEPEPTVIGGVGAGPARDPARDAFAIHHIRRPERLPQVPLFP